MESTAGAGRERAPQPITQAAVAEQADGLETSLNELAWLAAFQRSNASERSADDLSRAAAATDKLLASYFPET